MKEPHLISKNNLSKKRIYNLSKDKNYQNINNSSNSLNRDETFNELNNEIKNLVENCNDTNNFSSESEDEDSNKSLDKLLESKYWIVSKGYFSEKKEPISLYDDTKKLSKIDKSEGSNKQSTQSNEDDNNNLSSYEINNSPINTIYNNDNEDKIKKNIEEEKVYINNNNNVFSGNGMNNMNKNYKYMMNFDSDSYYPYENISFNMSQIPFYSGIYLNQALYPIFPNFNNQQMNKFIPNNTNINKYKDNNDNMIKQTIKDNKELDLPKLKQQNITNNNAINNNPKLSICPKIQSNNNNLIKQINEKANNSSNILPGIVKKENNSNDNKTNNNKNTNSSSSNSCPLIEQNNKIKINNKEFINNKNIISNNKSSSKGEKQILNLDDIVTGKDKRTTVMIRNIPIKYTDDILTEEISEFNGKYDCLYMPFDYEKNGNKGYAFINFVNPLHILYFYEKFNGKKWSQFESSKICELNCAHFQGINEIQKHAKNYKGQTKPSYYSRNDNNKNIIIPIKYLAKLKMRFPKIQYSENKSKKIILVKSFA